MQNYFAKISFLFFFLWVFLFCPKLALANNKVGIHILEPGELSGAANMINSNGGKWGYVTIVLRDDDFNKDKWQGFFDDCRRQHVIPIIRIATRMLPNETWAKPDINNLSKWPEFLNSLNWPVKKQIVTIFNEPNHAKEWGGELKPAEYAHILDKLINEFKSRNNNFFILNAGFDQAADNSKTTMNESLYWQWMQGAVPGIFNKLDGLASHSYPNHGFIGSPNDDGKASVRGYEWELDYLKSLRLDKDLPVFITETGWPHKEGVSNKAFYDAKTVAEYIEEAFNFWQKDERVAAVTPFVFNFPEPPFDHFSWLKKDGNEYPQVAKVLGIAKKKGEPEQVKNYEIINLKLADMLPTNYIYQGEMTVKNTGQWILGENESFGTPIEASQSGLEIKQTIIGEDRLIEPGEIVKMDFKIETGTKSAEHTIDINGQDYRIYVFKPWDLKNQKISLPRQLWISFKLWWENFSKK